MMTRSYRSFRLVALLLLPLSFLVLSAHDVFATPVTLNFSSDLQGFTDTGVAGGTTTYSTTVGSGSLHLTNPSGWNWRAQLNVNSGSTGSGSSVYQALQQAGAYGGTMSFNLILTTPGASGISSGFGGVGFLVAINQDSANGGGWDQLVATTVASSSYPVSTTTTIPVQINLVPCTNSPVNGNDSVLSLRSDSSWYQIQLGTTVSSVSSVEWYIDNVTITPNAPPPPPPPPGGSLTLEAENGTLTGNCYVTTATPGYSDTGYVTGFQNSSDTVNWTFTATPGLYDLVITFYSPYGQKGFNGTINGHGFSGMFPQTTGFSVFDAGTVEVVPGVNTIQIGGGWNYYNIDNVILTPIPSPPPPVPVPATLADPQATFAARSLMASLVADYGKHTWAGQHDMNELAYIQNTAGHVPVIVEGDFMDYSPSRVAFQGMPANYTETYMTLENSGNVLSFCWHWNAPTNLINTPGQEWWRGFYTSATTFDVAAAMANTNSPEYALILRDIDAIAVQLKKVASNNIPVIWRPLHEADGGWFWWGAKGPDAFKQLWRLLFNRLTGYHGIHNLIWVLASPDPNWYPGDDVVDVVGLDGYPSDVTDTLSSQWQALKARLDGVKLITLSEFGGVPDIERMHRFGVWWSWFSPWSGSYGPSGMPTSTVIRIYQSPEVITLDEVNAMPPKITSNGPLSGGTFPFMGTGPHSASYHVLSSTDATIPLSNWSVLTNGTFKGGVFSFTDPAPGTGPQRFYIVVKP